MLDCIFSDVLFATIKMISQMKCFALEFTFQIGELCYFFLRFILFE